ncbi:MAG: LacI family DNA-binding transcriptional regulator [Fimbriimonas sp.]
MSNNRPTRRDVAELAGVAPSTVSLILNDRAKDLGIAEATRQRVEEAARTLGYYANRHIRAIRSGRTGNIGLYLRHDQWGTATGYWAALRGALDRAISESDLGLLVHCGREDIPTEEAFARQAGGVVDGVLIFNSANDPIAARLLETGMRAVEIGDSAGPLPYVAVDAADGIRQALEHLSARGYRRPCFVNFPSPYESSIEGRREAFERQCLRLFGFVGPSIDDYYGETAFEALMGLDPRPDCAVCVSDEHALGLLAAALRRGLKVPRDLAITGFDCLPTLGLPCTVTSVCTPLEELTRVGLAKLLALIDGLPTERETVLPVSLRIGDTT